MRSVDGQRRAFLAISREKKKKATFIMKANLPGKALYILLAVFKTQFCRAVVHATFERHIVHYTHHYARGFDIVDSPINNVRDIYYLAEIQVGTPGQPVLLMVDTGSTDSWVNSISLSHDFGAIYRTWGGFFNCTQSSTCKNETDRKWAITYTRGGAIGNLVSDDWTVDDTTVDQFEFAAAQQQTGGPGVLGLGYRSNDSPDPVTGEKRNEMTFTEQLVKSKAIDCVAFSIWLNDLNSPRGNLLFGAVDLAKFSGELHKTPFISNGELTTGKADNNYSLFYVMVKGFKIRGTKSTNSTGSATITLDKPVLIDSGTAFLYLPHDAAVAFHRAINATYDARYDQFYLPTNEIQRSANIEFEFSDFSLSIGLKGVFLDPFDQQDSEINGIPVRWSGIKAAKGDNAIFGDVFLRNVYVTFDLGNNMAGIAKAKYTNETNVVRLGASGIKSL